MHGPTSSFIFTLHVVTPHRPFSHWVPSARSGTLSCPSPAQNPTTSSFLIHMSAFTFCSHSVLALLLTRIPSTLRSHKRLGFLLLSIAISCKNYHNSLHSTISVTDTSFSIPQISIFLILSLLVCLNYLISVPTNLLSHVVNTVQLSEQYSTVGR